VGNDRGAKSIKNMFSAAFRQKLARAEWTALFTDLSGRLAAQIATCAELLASFSGLMSDLEVIFLLSAGMLTTKCQSHRWMRRVQSLSVFYPHVPSPS
jgi:hypothetical protein